MGSSRTVARLLSNLGIGAFLADPVSGLLFQRRAFRASGARTPRVHAAPEEGQTAEVSLEDFTVRHLDSARC
jgi:hypothetical protein